MLSLALLVGTLVPACLVAATPVSELVGKVPNSLADRAATWYRPTLNSSILVDLDNQPISSPIVKTKSGVSINAGVIVVDMEGTSANDIKKYKADGKKVVCYVSVGTFEPGRTDAAQIDPACYCGPGVAIDSSTGKCKGKGANANYLGDWDEWWFDIHSAGCKSKVLKFVSGRFDRAKAKGCDGMDMDNVDAYNNKQNFGITAQDQVDYLLALSKQVHSLGLSVSLKNAGDLLRESPTKATKWESSLIAAFDFGIIESCLEQTTPDWDMCALYNGFLAAGKPQILLEYEDGLTSCPKLPAGRSLSVFSGTVVDSNAITLYCPSAK